MATMRLLERYSQAVNSDNLSVDARTTWSDTDVLGAAGIAGKHNPLGLALTRLLADCKPQNALNELAVLAFNRSHHLRVRISRVEAYDLSCAVLAHFRFGTCQPCGGTGYMVIKGTPVHGDECGHCKGTRKIPFDPLFPPEWLELAQWLAAEIERSQVQAGSDAMKALAPRLDL
jgi:hypothetical protein